MQICLSGKRMFIFQVGGCIGSKATRGWEGCQTPSIATNITCDRDDETKCVVVYWIIVVMDPSDKCHSYHDEALLGIVDIRA